MSLGIIRNDIDELQVLTHTELNFSHEGLQMTVHMMKEEALTEFNLDFKQEKLREKIKNENV